MAQASAEKNMDLDARAFDVQGRSEGIVGSACRARLGAIATEVGTPAMAFASILGLLFTAQAFEPLFAPPARELERYARVHTRKGRCLGLIVRKPDKARAYFGGNDRLPNPLALSGPEASALRLISLQAVVRKRVRLEDGTVGIVRRALGAPVTNRGQFVLDSGKRGDAAGSCEAS